MFHTDEQKEIAIESLNKAKLKDLRRKIHTEIIPYDELHIAEDYHQKYILRENPWALSRCNFKSDVEIRESTLATRLNGFLSGNGQNSASVEIWRKEAETFGLPGDFVEDVVKIIKGEKSVGGASCGLW